ncbi:MAG: hypothetical protein AMJ46_03290 [Latescibacteria bacterium DG_63]|nr:MAG: hypothetical protein AMJ46_03290 [Latescibacteria bacterium DG_63]
MRHEKKIVLFSDLDGTLLDRDTYSFSGAEKALSRIREHGVPLVLATSKTRHEVEVYRQRLSNSHPFIIENGAAAFIPSGYFPHLPSLFTKRGDYLVIELGLPYADIREMLSKMRERTSVPLRGLGDMTPEEVAEISNLDLEEARLSKMREYTEPCVLEGERNEAILARIHDEVRELGLKLTVGEKFLHLSGPHNKGELVRRLSVLFRTSLKNILTVGLGDGKNDVEMLAECQIAILLRKKGGLLDEDVMQRVPNALPYEAGPAGWNRAVLELMEGKLT